MAVRTAALALVALLGLGTTAAGREAPFLGVQPYGGEPEALGKRNDVFHYFIEADKGWGGLDGSDEEVAKIREARKDLAKHPGRLVLLSHPGVPDGGGSLEACANGAYDARYRGYGRAIREEGLRGAVIRVGWEWDGGGTELSIHGDRSRAHAYRRCFRNIVKGIRAGYDGPEEDIRFDFNSTTGIAHRGGRDLLEAGYPGDDVVDVISVEGYDNRPCKVAADVECRWERVLASLELVRDFARERGKPMAIPEWGIWNTTGMPRDGDTVRGFDNPTHIRHLCRFARDPANNVLYYVYFLGRTSTWHNLNRPENRLSAQAYAAACASGSRGG
jgi:hypothetical protein